MPRRVRCQEHGYVSRPTYEYVGRPSRLGNPFAIGMKVAGRRGLLTCEEAVMLFAWRVWEHPSLLADIRAQRGKDIGCFCGLRQRCHGDVILELANAAVS